MTDDKQGGFQMREDESIGRKMRNHEKKHKVYVGFVDLVEA